MYEQMYKRRRKELLKDKSINSKNKEIIEKFLVFEEYKLKRKEGLSEVDERSYKTLYFYVSRITNINRWFNGKVWEDLTKEEIKKVIDDLEDGKITNQYGRRYTNRSLYYQMFQGKFFSLAGKNHIVRDMLEEFSIKGRKDTNHVRFIEEADFRKIVDCINDPIQRGLCWISWDYGENISSLVSLSRDDVKKQFNSDTGEPEYLIIFSKDKLKRSRTPRSELNNYPETVRYLDIILENIKPVDKTFTNKFVKNKNISSIHAPDKLFKFGWKVAEKFFRKAVEKSGVRCMPGGERVTWKDLRSSMACDLLKKGWTTDEVNSRLGHKPSSRIIDRYVSYLALDRHKPKQKVYQGSLKKLETELEKQKEMNKLQQIRFENLKNEQEQMKIQLRLFMKKSKAELLETLKELEKVQEKEIIIKTK